MLFDTFLPDREGERGGAQFRTKHTNLSLGARGEGGQIFMSTAQLGGVLKLSRHPIITPPHLSWVFPFSSFFPF